jgi:crotonobetainyl-CoA:carnitine CoA-transferase CaiB-like acyl-CoA transferase
MSDSYPKTSDLFELMWRQLGGDTVVVEAVSVYGDGAIASPFALTDFTSASFAAVGAAVAELLALDAGSVPPVRVDRALSSAWLTGATRHLGRVERSGFDDLSDFYRTADDRWLRTHTNYPHHRDRTVEALGVSPTKEALATAIAEESADVLEARIYEHGGVAAASRSLGEWAVHPQGAALATEPMVEVTAGSRQGPDGWVPLPERPLVGIRVLDLTRVIAGPTATRMLAGYGAEVLRIDPPGFEEAGGRVAAAGEVTLGKRCARLDLQSEQGHTRFLELLSEADVLVHGLRPRALDDLGLEPDVLDKTRPGLVEVTLDAYGWRGPWALRRGFDSIVQTASGMALESARWSGNSKPTLVPPILDYGTGYLMAAAAIHGLAERLRTSRGSKSRLALADTAAALIAVGIPDAEGPIPHPYPGPFEPAVIATPAGAIQRLVPPVAVGSTQLRWDRSGELLGSSVPAWAGLASVGRDR